MDHVAPFTISIDTREQRPYEFARIIERVDGETVPVKVLTVVRTLTTGEYSNAGMEKDVSIERKCSIDELASCVGAERRRFEAELERLAAIPSAHLVLEFSLA